MNLAKTHGIDIERADNFDDLFKPIRLDIGSESEIWSTPDGRALKRFKNKFESPQNWILNEYAVLRLLGREVDYYVERESNQLKGLIMKKYTNGNIALNFNSKKKHLHKRWICQLSDQILQLHRMNIPHGDINCANIVLDDEDNAFLIDFTTSGPEKPAFCHIQNTPKDLIGTKFNNSKELDAYAFGIVVYEIVTGMPIYETMYVGQTQGGYTEESVPPGQGAVLGSTGSRTAGGERAAQGSGVKQESESSAKEEEEKK
ncbi:hypothetical protein IWW48_006306 [Coemansia sp. RSA 1200]|nr:hypothetical protein IWW48_006306 [Coemansia sp. RSA 1200]